MGGYKLEGDLFLESQEGLATRVWERCGLDQVERRIGFGACLWTEWTDLLLAFLNSSGQDPLCSAPLHRAEHSAEIGKMLKGEAMIMRKICI